MNSIQSQYAVIDYSKSGVLAKEVWLLTVQSRVLTTITKQAFENIVGKGENAGNQHFLLFPTKFSTVSKLRYLSYT